MWRLCVLLGALLFALLLGSGCQTEDGKGPFDAAIRDWNGENMQMKGFKDQ
jgi:hypothetical protein